MATTLQPSTNSELQLYRVLQRANLLQYFDTFITQGGDDVQQLCEAGEDEFLEIMALVGMASKPLHVRRLQKALQEWVANPTAFDVPKKFPTIVMSMAGGGGASGCGSRPGSTPSPMSSTEASLSPTHSIPCSLAEPQHHLARPNNSSNASATPGIQTGSTSASHNAGTGSNHVDNHKAGQNSSSSHAQSSNSHPSPSASGNTVTSPGLEQSPPWALQTRGPTPPDPATSGIRRGARGGAPGSMTILPTEPAHPSPPDSPHHFKDVIKDGVYNPNDAAYIPTVSHPVLMEHQISAIAAAATTLARNLPTIEPKTLPKKQNSKDITTVMLMNPDDPNRLDAMRKYAAIYGRFDSKRKNHRPMSLHEISVNEAAAQLCNHFPALLTRREELFPLARQVVRDSGYQYSKGHSRLAKPDLAYHEFECVNAPSRAAEVLVQPKLETVEQLTLSQASHLSPFASAPGPVALSADEDTYNELQVSECSVGALAWNAVGSNKHDQITYGTNHPNHVFICLSFCRYKKGGPKGLGGCDRVNLSFKQQTSKQGMKKNFNNNIVGSNSFVSNNNRMPSSNNNNNNNSTYRFNNSPNNNGGGVFSSNMNNSNNNSNNLGNGTSFHSNGTVNGSNSDTDTSASNNNPLNTLCLAAMQNHRDSLFEEGLRIATQYGMSDFAKELIGMKTQGKVLGSDDSGISMGTSYFPQSSAALAPSPSSLFTSSSSPAASSAVTAVASSMAAAVSSDNISASSPEYLAPASGCRIHTPPSSAAVPVSTLPSSSSSLPLSSPSPASVLFPSSVISPKQAKSPKGNKRSCDNPSLVSSSTSSAKSAKISKSDEKDSAQATSSSAESSVTSSSSSATPTPKISSNQDSSITNNINTNPTTPATTSEQQGSTTTTTTITTKSGQVIEVETRRSSRRKNGEPDYYLINGGEKRFRSSSTSSSAGSTPNASNSNFTVGASPSGRRGSSSDRRKLSSEGMSSISSPSKPYILEPCHNNNNNNNNNSKNSNGSGDSRATRLDVNEVRFRNPPGEIHKVRMGFQQRIEPSDKDKR
ncbi:ngfi-a-binding protein 1 [Plakobranchus ocellatus]|uniref:Ngfi-a-binding protein 1 n=1 Tax=Plakobranchus ocellatus TaxID=259542 RepID=A0AAV3Y119_9GAST|nr:ngfi-a-binding protein 1 [Plakobranchus ocellatus]